MPEDEARARVGHRLEHSREILDLALRRIHRRVAARTAPATVVAYEREMWLKERSDGVRGGAHRERTVDHDERGTRAATLEGDARPLRRRYVLHAASFTGACRRRGP